MKRLTLLTVCGSLMIAAGFATYFASNYVLAVENESKTVVTASSAQQDTQPNNATVSFGAWTTLPVTDRHPNRGAPALPNLHQLVPRIATIRAGGTVNFIIAGFHQVAVYDNGIQPVNINWAMVVAPTNGGPPLINDPNNRIYRGLDPSTQPQDRVEVVQFSNPGTYLVICAVQPHFREGMYGFVEVTPGNGSAAAGNHSH